MKELKQKIESASSSAEEVKSAKISLNNEKEAKNTEANFGDVGSGIEVGGAEEAKSGEDEQAKSDVSLNGSGKENTEVSSVGAEEAKGAEGAVNASKKNGVISSNSTSQKSDKVSLGLFIAGTVLAVIALVLIACFGAMVVKLLTATDANETLGGVFGTVIYLVYFSIPAFVLGGISLVLNIVAVVKMQKLKALKIISLVFTVLVLVLNAVFIALMYLEN